MQEVGEPRFTPRPLISSVLKVIADPETLVVTVCVVLSENTPR